MIEKIKQDVREKKRIIRELKIQQMEAWRNHDINLVFRIEATLMIYKAKLRFHQRHLELLSRA